MSEVPAAYAVGDPGDEQSTVVCDCPICRIGRGPARDIVPISRPQYDDLAAAITRFAALRPHYLDGYLAYHDWRLACDALCDLATRLTPRTTEGAN